MQTKSINYLESRTVNVGDFEKIVSQLSYTVEAPVSIPDTVVSINHSETMTTLDGVGMDFKSASKVLVNRVRAVLDRREYEIRTLASDFVDYDIDSKADQVKPKKKKTNGVKKKKKKQEQFRKSEDDLDLS